MKLVIAFLFVLTHLMAYEKGDTVNDLVAEHLGCKENKIYIIDFFGSWCSSCKKELPLLSKLSTLIDPQRVEIIGVDVDKDINAGMAFQKRLKSENKLNFRVINDPQNLIISEFNPIGMPTLYYVKNRKVLGVITGAVDKIDEKILADLKEME